jgi:plastocyanin
MAALGAVCAGITFAADAVIEGTVKFPAKAGAALVAVVYLEGDFPPAAAESLPTLQLEQKQFQFTPAVLPVRRGTKVEFPNRDDEYHNVLSYSKAKEFDLGRYLKSEKPPTVVFDKAGVIELNCEIHEHMRGYVLVLETPHFTVTGAEGRFRLEHLPPGKYRLKAWLNPKTVWEQPAELADGATLRVDFAPQ